MTLQYILRHINHHDLTVALYGCGFDLINNHILNNVSQNIYIRIIEDMGNKAVRVRDIYDAQKRITDIIDNLEKSGEIVIRQRCKAAADEITNHALNKHKEPSEDDISELEDADLPF